MTGTIYFLRWTDNRNNKVNETEINKFLHQILIAAATGKSQTQLENYLERVKTV